MSSSGDFLFIFLLGQDLVSLSSDGESESLLLRLSLVDLSLLLGLILLLSHLLGLFSCFLSILECLLL
jgi:hypothetical protein